MTVLNEYDFIRCNSQIFRVFGRYHPENHLLLLLRYWFDGNKWIKPPKHGAESNDPDVVKLYSIPTTYSENYQLTLGILPSSRIEHIYPALDCQAPEVPEFLDISEILSEFEVGLSGSHLVNLQNKNSDLDIVIYGIDEFEDYSLSKLELAGYRRLVDARNSSMLNSFQNKWKHTPPTLESRSILSWISPSNRKIDFHFSLQTGIETRTMNKYKSDMIETNISFVVECDKKRHLFPGQLTGVTQNGQKIEVYFLDHSMHFCKSGDTVHTKAVLVHSVGSDDVKYLVKRLVQIENEQGR